MKVNRKKNKGARRKRPESTMVHMKGVNNEVPVHCSKTADGQDRINYTHEGGIQKKHRSRSKY